MTPKNKRIVIEEENGDHVDEFMVSYSEAKAIQTILNSMVGIKGYQGEIKNG